VDMLRDHTLPPLDGLYLGGGFPEMFMAELEANVMLREDVRSQAAAGIPVYAECGGLMYLARSLRWGTRVAQMAGVFPVHVEMTGRPQGHGYTSLHTLPGNPWFEGGQTLRGHEFHHSRLTGIAGERFAYQVERGRGIDGRYDGLIQNRVLASYTHLHAAGVPDWAPRFVEMATTFHGTHPKGHIPPSPNRLSAWMGKTLLPEEGMA